MRRRAEWSYVQARLQARHGERPGEPDWRMIEAAKTLAHFIERSRSTPLRRFTGHLDAQMTSHAIERILRVEWRRYVAEIAAWTPPEWRTALLWAAHVPDLAVLDRLLRGDAPDWTREDPAFAPLARRDGRPGAAGLEGPLFSSLSPTKPEDGGLAGLWLAHWTSLWPRRGGTDRRWLAKLVAMAKDHAAQLARADARATSAAYRRAAAAALTRLFRRRSGTPVAAFCHLALIALDLERLRGGLVRRRLFDGEHRPEAA
ncbi:MAG TPA: hypothetical protein VEI03_00800 [Stellaceae bacterium]|nr:hypothetical protein [Stellaceae bacterium]